MRRLLLLVARNRWPLYLGGLLAMAITAYAVLIYVATRPSAPRPIPRYYETAERWDADEAAAEASRQLGWSLRYEIPAGVPHVAGTPRPVDVRVADREGRGVAGLAGRLFVVRPSDHAERTPGTARSSRRSDTCRCRTPCSDGEIVELDALGKSSFERIQRRFTPASPQTR